MSCTRPRVLKMRSELSTTSAKASVSCRYVRCRAAGAGTASRWVPICSYSAGAGAGESVVRACRNASGARGGVL
ncbi:hypothetical protein BGY98DRAFT_995902, partial [Russula aff. rugulosa BPL654]